MSEEAADSKITSVSVESNATWQPHNHAFSIYSQSLEYELITSDHRINQIAWIRITIGLYLIIWSTMFFWAILVGILCVLRNTWKYQVFWSRASQRIMYNVKYYKEIIEIVALLFSVVPIVRTELTIVWILCRMFQSYRQFFHAFVSRSLAQFETPEELGRPRR